MLATFWLASQMGQFAIGDALHRFLFSCNLAEVTSCLFART